MYIFYNTSCVAILLLSLYGNHPQATRDLKPAPLGSTIIVIDPGHPSEVGLGARGKRLTEVRIAWAVAQDLRKLLERDGYSVILTKRTLMQRVTNRRRAEIANDVHAALMVRLHCDSKGGSGFAVYYPDRSATVQGHTGPNAGVLARSKSCAQSFHRAFAKAMRAHLNDRGLYTDRATAIGCKQGALTGSVFSKVPVLLVEMVVLSDRRDEAFIEKPANQQVVAMALLEGIKVAVPRRTATDNSTHSRRYCPVRSK
jgi:N-acetylmuramoyl-L-alanine amidase